MLVCVSVLGIVGCVVSDGKLTIIGGETFTYHSRLILLLAVGRAVCSNVNSDCCILVMQGYSDCTQISASLVDQKLLFPY